MVFSIPSYLGVGDRYKHVVDERGQGATFAVPHPKTGHNPDALFEKEHLYLWRGERGGDAETVRRREMKESHSRNLTANGFAYTGPSPQPVGAGSYFGCFQATPYPHVPNHPEKHEQAVARRDVGHRGIYAAPSKKGCGYWYAHLGISDVGENYVANIYDQARINERIRREEWRHRMPPEPFKPAGREGFTFDENILTGSSQCYAMTVPFTEKRPEPVFVHFRVDQPWRPAGYVDTRPAVLEYWEDPYRGYDPRKEPKEYVKKPSNAVFLPSSRVKDFWYTQSIVFKRL